MEAMMSGASTAPAWLSTHPAFPDRQLQLIDLMPKALETYENRGETAARRVIE
jgi:hypothetical protein